MVELAKPYVGELRERVTRIARDNKLLLTIGMPEKNGTAIYNSMIAVGPNGDLLARYRKTHLWAAESKWAQPGDEFASFRTEQAHFGLMLCYDTRFPEVARALALQGAEVLLVASAWRSSHAHEWRLCAQARAIDNGVYLAGCDAILEADHFECAGASIIAGPDGSVLARSHLKKEENDYSRDRFDGFEKRRDDLPLLQHRRPELY